MSRHTGDDHHLIGRRLRAVLQEDRLHLFDSGGTLVLSEQLADGNGDTRVMSLTTVSGDTIVVEKMGCGCGGG